MAIVKFIYKSWDIAQQLLCRLTYGLPQCRPAIDVF